MVRWVAHAAAWWGHTVRLGDRHPVMCSYAKCLMERKLALITKGRLKDLLEERGLRIEIKGIDKTPAHRAQRWSIK